MLPDPDVIRLRHMLDAAQEAVGYAQGRTRSDLNTDTMLARALVQCVEIIGEAASRITRATRDQLSSLPWAEMISMRNRLIHAYFDIDLDKVWATVADDLPPLIGELSVILGEGC